MNISLYMQEIWVLFPTELHLNARTVLQCAHICYRSRDCKHPGVHLHLISRAEHSKNVFWSCLATVWGLLAQSLALSEITGYCRSLAMDVSYLLNDSSINTMQLFFFHTLMSTMNKLISLALTVPYSLQIYTL